MLSVGKCKKYHKSLHIYFRGPFCSQKVIDKIRTCPEAAERAAGRAEDNRGNVPWTVFGCCQSCEVWFLCVHSFFLSGWLVFPDCLAVLYFSLRAPLSSQRYLLPYKGTKNVSYFGVQANPYFGIFFTFFPSPSVWLQVTVR